MKRLFALCLLLYLNGDKPAALRELQEARKGDRGFEKDFEEILNDSPELKGLKEDKEFLGKLW